MSDKVYLTQFPGDAHHKVFFATHAGEEKNAALLRGCTLTQFPGDAVWKLYVTPHRGEATIVILRKNFPR